MFVIFSVQVKILSSSLVFGIWQLKLISIIVATLKSNSYCIFKLFQLHSHWFAQVQAAVKVRSWKVIHTEFFISYRLQTKVSYVHSNIAKCTWGGKVTKI